MDKIRNLQLRSDLFRSIRNYFYDHGFIEVETPVKIHAPAPEEFIESVRSEGDFLRTSPELAMKVLLSEGMEKIFQIGSCFRANEFGRRHREELDAAWGGKGPEFAEVFELSEYGRKPDPKEIAFLRSVGAKWTGPEPKVFKKGESIKTQGKVG